MTAIYDLGGRYCGSSADRLSKGIYIQNGRKFVVNSRGSLFCFFGGWSKQGL